MGESVAATSEQVRWLLWGLAVLLVLVPTWSAWSNRRGVAGAQRGIVDVRAVARQLAEATRGVSSSSQVLAAATARQAATNEETRATLVTLTNQVRSNATDADQARELSQESRTEAEAGVGAARDLTVALSQLQESSRDVQKVLKLIDDIAFQTNLLALNAAVEAARAGDAGAGFAVVAGEVRSLAHRSAEAARGSQDTIDETLRRMARGVELADQVQQRLQVISARTRSLDEVSARVATASKAQQAAVEQLEASVEAVEQVVMQTSAEAEAGASAAEELTSQAGFLERTMTALSESVGASASTHQPSSVPRSHAVERHGLMAPASS